MFFSLFVFSNSICFIFIRNYLDNQKLDKEKAAKKRKNEDVLEELQNLKAKRARLQKDADALECSADKLSQKAEATSTLKFVIESNALRKSAKDKRGNIAELTSHIDKKLKDLSN